MKSLAESCSRQIRAWADQLQNSDIQGPRRLTEKSRHAWQADRRAEAFLQKLQDIRDAAASPAPIRDATANHPPIRDAAAKPAGGHDAAHGPGGQSRHRPQ